MTNPHSIRALAFTFMFAGYGVPSCARQLGVVRPPEPCPADLVRAQEAYQTIEPGRPVTAVEDALNAYRLCRDSMRPTQPNVASR